MASSQDVLNTGLQKTTVSRTGISKLFLLWWYHVASFQEVLNTELQKTRVSKTDDSRLFM